MPFNLKEFLNGILVNMALPGLKTYGSAEFTKFLQKMHDLNPKIYSQALTIGYPLIDIQIEDFVKTTKTEVDDELVTELKKVIEKSALDNGITLPNLDMD